MSRRGGADLVVVGAGVVGAATALMAAREGLRVVLVESREPAPWRAEAPDLRVYALAPDNFALLDSLGVGGAIRRARAHPYRRMRVWDAAGGGELDFDATRLGRDALGHIVENDLLVDRLWAACLAEAGIERACPAAIEALAQDGEGVRATLDDGRTVDEALVRALIEDEVTRMPPGLERLAEAVALFTQLCFAQTCESFLTLPAYEVLDG